MIEVHQPGKNAFEANLALHRRQMDRLTPPEFKGPLFDEARKLVVDTLEGRSDPEITIKPIELVAVNTDAEKLFFDPKDQ